MTRQYGVQVWVHRYIYVDPIYLYIYKSAFHIFVCPNVHYCIVLCPNVHITILPHRISRLDIEFNILTQHKKTFFFTYNCKFEDKKNLF